jgi:hypothetical protein
VEHRHVHVTHVNDQQAVSKKAMDCSASCDFSHFFFSTHLLLVLWSRIAVAFDRYVSIVQPLRYQSMMNHRVSLTVIFVIYLYVTVTRIIVHVFIGASCLLFLETKTHRLRDGGPFKKSNCPPRELCRHFVFLDAILMANR